MRGVHQALDGIAEAPVRLMDHLRVKLAAVVGLDGHLRSIPLALQVRQEAECGGAGVALGDVVGAGHEQKPRAHVADGILILWPVVVPDLRQQPGDVCQVYRAICTCWKASSFALTSRRSFFSSGGFFHSQYKSKTSLFGKLRYGLVEEQMNNYNQDRTESAIACVAPGNFVRHIRRDQDIT